MVPQIVEQRVQRRVEGQSQEGRRRIQEMTLRSGVRARLLRAFSDIHKSCGKLWG
jgi:hypothetical protein